VAEAESRYRVRPNGEVQGQELSKQVVGVAEGGSIEYGLIELLLKISRGIRLRIALIQ
jgi:hypothetical protein